VVIYEQVITCSYIQSVFPLGIRCPAGKQGESIMYKDDEKKVPSPDNCTAGACSCGCGHEHEHRHEHEHVHEHADACSCSCGCGCEKEHGPDRAEIIRIAAAAALFAVGLAIPEGKIFVFAASAVLAGWEIIPSAMRSLFGGGHVMDENFLMTAAAVGAFAIGEYAEGCAVLILFTLGEMLSHRALDSSRSSIRGLMDNRFRRANVYRDGSVVHLDAAQVEIGDRLIVMAGDGVPVDGVLLSGQASMDTSALTGESLPVEFSEGDEIRSGCICTGGAVELRAVRTYADSAAGLIIKMADEANGKKAASESFITRFAKVYTPIVVSLSCAVAVIGSAVSGRPSLWIYRALALLVISCPCALVISVPLTFFAAIGRASESGVLIKGGGVMEKLQKIDTLAFDKTGTLTNGRFEVREIIPADGFDAKELLYFAGSAAKASAHPLSRATAQRAEGSPMPDISHERAGLGVEAEVEGRRVLLGSRLLLGEHGIDAPEAADTAVFAAIDGKYAGMISFCDEIKEGAGEALSELRRLTGAETALLSGDGAEAARRVAGRLGIERVFAPLLPGGKVETIERLISEKRGGGSVVFVGDGINDAPVLARADVGLAVENSGGDAAAAAADALLMGGDISKIVRAVELSRSACLIAMQNIVFAIGAKTVVMILTVMGLSTMWAAVLADVGVALIAILNAMRIMRK